MPSSYVMLGSGVNAERGVPLRVGGLARRRMSRLPYACFPRVCAQYVLLVYNVGRGVDPPPLWVFVT